MKAAAWIIPVFALGAAAGAAALLYARPGPSKPFTGRPLLGGLWCPEPTRDLGEVWQTDDLAVPFELVNDDPAQTFTVALTGSCRCTRVEPGELTIGPGARATVTAHVDLERMPGITPVLGDFDERVTAQARGTGGAVRVVTMTFRGVSQPAYELSCQTLEFGAVVHSQTPEESAAVRCVAPGRVDGFDLVSVPDGLTARAERLNDTAFGLFVQPSADLPYGPFEGRLRFRADRQEGTFVTGSVFVRGEIVHDVWALPESLDLGTVQPGEAWAGTVTLGSRTGRAFDVVEAAAEGAELAEKDGTPERRAYDVTVCASQPGPVEGEVSFLVGEPGDEPHRVAVPVRGYCVLGPDSRPE